MIPVEVPNPVVTNPEVIEDDIAERGDPEPDESEDESEETPAGGN